MTRSRSDARLSPYLIAIALMVLVVLFNMANSDGASDRRSPDEFSGWEHLQCTEGKYVVFEALVSVRNDTKSPGENCTRKKLTVEELERIH